jgi:hypothetical protein
VDDDARRAAERVGAERALALAFLRQRARAARHPDVVDVAREVRGEEAEAREREDGHGDERGDRGVAPQSSSRTRGGVRVVLSRG